MNVIEKLKDEAFEFLYNTPVKIYQYLHFNSLAKGMSMMTSKESKRTGKPGEYIYLEYYIKYYQEPLPDVIWSLIHNCYLDYEEETLAMLPNFSEPEEFEKLLFQPICSHFIIDQFSKFYDVIRHPRGYWAEKNWRCKNSVFIDGNQGYWINHPTRIYHKNKFKSILLNLDKENIWVINETNIAYFWIIIQYATDETIQGFKSAFIDNFDHVE